MKVFLVHPRSLSPKQTYREYPLGLGMIATSLRERGHQTYIFDQNAEQSDDDALFEQMRIFDPEVVGFSVTTPNYPSAKMQIARLRREKPQIRIIAGGIHANLFPQDLLADGAEFVVLGRGESIVCDLLDIWTNPRMLAAMPGLALRDESGQFAINSQNISSTEPDRVITIDRNVYNLPLYRHHSLLASLGCPYKCNFCCNYSGTILQDGALIRPVEDVLQEMAYLSEEYAAKQVFFIDDVFFIRRSLIREFCRKLRDANLEMQWIAQLRADLVNDAVAQEMAQAGCRRIYFGVESGSDAILQRANKGLNIAQIRSGIQSAKATGLRVKAGMIYGLPGNYQEQAASIPLLRELRPHEVSIHWLIPFPGTAYYADPARHGIRIRDLKDFRDFSYGGIGDNISYDYLSPYELEQLLAETISALESDGYVSSDIATDHDEYIYSTPMNACAMQVFSAAGAADFIHNDF
jgi:anaerobic magnesium-protoporphyrin IX monomethyl ester cyclase